MQPQDCFMSLDLRQSLFSHSRKRTVCWQGHGQVPLVNGGVDSWRSSGECVNTCVWLMIPCNLLACADFLSFHNNLATLSLSDFIQFCKSSDCVAINWPWNASWKLSCTGLLMCLIHGLWHYLAQTVVKRYSNHLSICHRCKAFPCLTRN